MDVEGDEDALEMIVQTGTVEILQQYLDDAGAKLANPRRPRVPVC